jgi:hypothetical protein
VAIPDNAHREVCLTCKDPKATEGPLSRILLQDAMQCNEMQCNAMYYTDLVALCITRSSVEIRTYTLVYSVMGADYDDNGADTRGDSALANSQCYDAMMLSTDMMMV